MALNIYALAVISYSSDHLYLSVSNIMINIHKVCWRNVLLAQKVLILLNGSALLAKSDDINII